MERYLNRCVDSLLALEILDDIEIIIVNDGSKDATLSIANQYKAQYPNSVVVIDKPNGHYGSTVNAALKVATGKYFRILDADDWFNTKALVVFVNKLKEIDVDCVFTKYTIHDYNKKNIIEQNVNNVIFNCKLIFSEYLIPSTCYAMHSLTYKLEFLHDINYKQTEGICYTDTEYVFYPLCCANTIYNIDISLYQYYLGREDQSMSHRIISKNFHHFEKLLNSYISNWHFNATKNVERVQCYYIQEMMSRMLNICIFYTWDNREIEAISRMYIKTIKKLSSNIYNKLIKLKYKGIPYVNIWVKHQILYKYILLPIICYFSIKK